MVTVYSTDLGFPQPRAAVLPMIAIVVSIFLAVPAAVRWGRLRAALAVLMLVPCVTLTAQGSRNTADTLRINDSIVVAVVGKVIVEKASHLLVRAALEGTQVPLQITLPEGATSPRWQALLDHLMLSLRGRSLQTPDNDQYVIEVKGLVLGVNSMRISVHVGSRWKCQGRWLEEGTGYEVFWERPDQDSSWFRMKTEMELPEHSLCAADPE